MSKLYQEELSRLMQSQQRARLQGGDKPPPELPGLPGLFPGLAGGLFQRAQQSDLQRAMDVYQQEFNRLHQNALAAAFRAQQKVLKMRTQNLRLQILQKVLPPLVEIPSLQEPDKNLQ